MNEQEAQQAQTIAKWFPIQDEKEAKYSYGLKRVPFEFMLEHEPQALKNHGQTILRLAERGGLSARETILVVSDQPLSRFFEINWDDVNPHATINHNLVRWYQKKVDFQAQKIQDIQNGKTIGSLHHQIATLEVKVAEARKLAEKMRDASERPGGGHTFLPWERKP